MEGISPSVWFPVVTLVIGVLLKAVFDSWTEKRRAAFDRESRVEKRKEIILMQRIDLQRKALGDVQVAIADLLRCTTQMNLADTKAFHETGKWGEDVLPDDLSEKSRAAFREVTLTKVRVRDERVREMASKISLLCTKVSFAKSVGESEDCVHAAGRLFQEFNEEIGASLRSLESEEQAFLT